jgi:hypothetical protein
MTFRQCSQKENIPEQCKIFRYAYFECRRGMVDMRTRMRGNIKGYSILQQEHLHETKADPATEPPRSEISNK